MCEAAYLAGCDGARSAVNYRIMAQPARRDLAEMLGAGVEVDTRWQAILDDCGNHGAHTSQDLESSFAAQGNPLYEFVT
jgi:hypothetical protein